ncbi:branched-chain amino acid ABC transporter permease [Parafrigoribacterium humi]|jgi:branched-chain amino acid transport system permease protein|uniref:branched-chain amino acid ABC transporter permease n=1 Tax=Parafrigoribacterium humi TaxID=3144664 RepID=UPI0032ED0887
MKGKYIIIAVVAIIAAILPLMLDDLTFYVQMVLAAVVVTGLSLLMGFSGQVSLGQGAFVAVGALTVALLTTKAGVPPLIALICAPIAAGLFAYVVGAPLLRLRGHYLAFGTLALLLIVQAVMGNITFFGGGIGISGIPPLGIGNLTVSGQLTYAYIALIALAVVLLISRNLVGSRFGRGIRALAGSESAASSSGVPILRSKLSVFAISGAFAGLAGGIGAFFIPYVSQDSFPPMQSFSYVIMAVIGGLGTLWGGVIGAVLVSVLLQVLNTLGSLPGLPPTAAPMLQYAGYGIVLICVLLFIPRGIQPTITDALARFRARRNPAGSPPPPSTSTIAQTTSSPTAGAQTTEVESDVSSA